MTLIEQIKADREAGTGGPWTAFTDDTSSHTNIVSHTPIAKCVFSLAGRHKWEADICRIARVPDMEAALLAVEDALNLLEGSVCDERKSAASMVREAIRKATGTVQ